MSNIRFVLIICLIICLWSCCERQSKIEIPSAFASQASIHNIRIIIDEEFNTTEQISIQNSLENWRVVSGNYIKFKYIYKQKKPGRLEDYFWIKQYNNSIFIWKAGIKDISTKFSEEYINYVGFWDLHGNIVIFTDRLDGSADQFYNVVTHEIGHMLGLRHIVYEKSVMQPKDTDIADCITKDDAYRLCLIYGCKPNPECN